MGKRARQANATLSSHCIKQNCIHGKNNIKKQKETEKKGIDDLVAAGRKKKAKYTFSRQNYV